MKLTSMLTFATLALSTQAFSMPNDVVFNAMEVKYPTTLGTKLYDCLTCHTKEKWGRNAYGNDLNNYLLDHVTDPNTDSSMYTTEFIVEAMTAVDAMDSDGDGFSNKAEFEAGTFPGDASDVPSL